MGKSKHKSSHKSSSRSRHKETIVGEDNEEAAILPKPGGGKPKAHRPSCCCLYCCGSNPLMRYLVIPFIFLPHETAVLRYSIENTQHTQRRCAMIYLVTTAIFSYYRGIWELTLPFAVHELLIVNAYKTTKESLWASVIYSLLATVLMITDFCPVGMLPLAGGPMSMILAGLAELLRYLAPRVYGVIALCVLAITVLACSLSNLECVFTAIPRLGFIALVAVMCYDPLSCKPAFHVF